jgi:hypothetical protein
MVDDPRDAISALKPLSKPFVPVLIIGIEA